MTKKKKKTVREEDRLTGRKLLPHCLSRWETSREAALSRPREQFDRKTERLSVGDFQTGRKTDSGRQVGRKATRLAGRHGAVRNSQLRHNPASQQARGSVTARLINTASVWA